MNLDEAFKKELLEKINNPPSNLLVLRELLIDYKHKGIDKVKMVSLMETMRKDLKGESEDVLLELMDFVEGYCNSTLTIFDEMECSEKGCGEKALHPME